MPTFLNTAEELANGTVITSSNAAAAGWDTVAVGTTGSTHTITTERAAHGTKSYEMDHKVGGGAHRLWDNFAEAGRVVTTARYYLTDVPTDFEDFGGVRNSAGNMMVLLIGSDGKFIVNAGSAGAGQSASRAPNVVPTDQWITVQIEVIKGTTTSNGTIGYRYFLGREPVGTPVFSWSSNLMNAGTTNVAAVWWGRSTGRNQARTVWYDTLEAVSLASGWPAAYQSPNTAPEVVLLGEAFELEPGDIQTLTANTEDVDGTIASITIQQVGGSPTVVLTGSGAVRTYQVPATVAGTTLSFNATATDDDGAATTSDTINHQILPAALLVRSGGAWVPAVQRVRVNGQWV